MRQRHGQHAVRLRPLRALAFAVSVTITLMAAVATVGLLPQELVAVASTPRAGESDDALVWPGHDPPVAATDRWGEVPAAVAPYLAGTAPQDRLRRHAVDPAPPDRSGEGRRVVLDLSRQQVWLVRGTGSVLNTYPVSGGVGDNLAPGRYAVYSRSAHATSFDYTSTMRWMVRFTEGANAAIGFHDIPRTSDGEPVQSRTQLGTPLSHGCIRQRPRDARALWRFAPVGTPVVVVA